MEYMSWILVATVSVRVHRWEQSILVVSFSIAFSNLILFPIPASEIQS